MPPTCVYPGLFGHVPRGKWCTRPWFGVFAGFLFFSVETAQLALPPAYVPLSLSAMVVLHRFVVLLPSFTIHTHCQAGTMAFQLRFVLSVAICSMASAQSICDSSVVSPMVFPIHNVTLQGAVLRRGVGFSPGTPPQPLAFFPYPYVTATYLLHEAPKIT